MAKPLIVTLPPGVIVSGGWTIRVTALNPDTGATVAGVVVSNVSLDVEGEAALLEFGPFMLVTGPAA